MAASTASLALLFLLLLLGPSLPDATAATGEDVIIKPLRTGSEAVGVVLIPAPHIPPERYAPLMRQLQNVTTTHTYTMWIGIPRFPLDVPERLAMPAAIERVLKSMNETGMPKSAKLFFVGHSSGGFVLQDYLAARPTLASGQVLMGSFLRSKYRGANYTTPTMTLGGELDGVCRFTRIMEQLGYRLYNTSNESVLFNYPVLILAGLSHMQFASGPPPELVRTRDLKPEINDSYARRVVAFYISYYVSIILKAPDVGLMPLQSGLIATLNFFMPLAFAYRLEGNPR